ncbi:hypothetical protein ACFQ1E_09740 [Sphingomonas canadensis]|uniref:Lipoprotein n=1 Tax=Sphingomonas canadensis TaxID=1219257 RepID=A0ABW3H5V7_9SPHN|nr:hypothetical protein [Sphingomonas canadensis]MCW3836600.1 hypothetical protein [Sphingomonas canadensis]
MKPFPALALLLMLPACQPAGEKTVEAVLDARLEGGTVTLQCRRSSSGSCHALFYTDRELLGAVAKAGESASAEGIGPGTRYCVDAEQPDPAKCRPRPLEEGEQIVRRNKTGG